MNSPQQAPFVPQQDATAPGLQPAPSPWASPGSPPPAPAPATATPRPAPKPGGGVLIAVVAGAVTFALLCALGAVGLTLAQRAGGLSLPTLGSPGPSEAPAGDPAPTPAATVQLTVASGSDRIQWIRVEDSAGAVVFDSKLQGSAALPVGPYRMSAKVVGRGKVGADIALDATLRVACKPDAERTVTCANDDGSVVWLLSP